MSFYARKNRTPGSWRLVEETYQNGRKRQQTVPSEVYEALGFRHTMSYEEAKERASRLNKQRSVARKKAAQAARNVANVSLIKSAFIPDVLFNSFLNDLIQPDLISEAHARRLHSHAKAIQALLVHLALAPSDWYQKRKRIYAYFVRKRYSLDYSKKLLRILNEWGHFSAHHDGFHFRPVPAPSRVERERIAEAAMEKDTYRGESEPLTPEALEGAKGSLTVPGNFEWLYLSIWFGLRPKEIDGLKRKGTWRLERGYAKGVDVLWIYQSKLVAISRDKRWKGIPILFKEQRRAVSYLESGNFKRPIHKTMRKVFSGNVTSYGGRKGFIDLMLERGQVLEDISGWLGHQSIEITWQKYRNKKRVGFTKKERKESA